MKTFVATHNAGKMRELRAIFKGSPLALTMPRKLAEVVEDGASYEANALLKAGALATALGERNLSATVLADDSGLEVDALQGRPGIYSARYGGAEISWPARRAALLDELRGIPPFRRTARFVCVLALLVPNREALTVRGEVAGFIMEAEQGANGFGYDPLFFHPPSNVTFARLAEREKNAISHRRRAADALLAMLRA